LIPLTPEELQRAVRAVAADYEAFVSRGPAPGTHEDPKAFTAHHAAARSALAHLEHLMKLDRGQPQTDAVAEAGKLIAEARRSIQLAEQEDREGKESAEDEDPA
jgi:hypothetical protein